jgi:hypothetical protein
LSVKEWTCYVVVKDEYGQMSVPLRIDIPRTPNIPNNYNNNAPNHVKDKKQLKCPGENTPVSPPAKHDPLTKTELERKEKSQLHYGANPNHQQTALNRVAIRARKDDCQGNQSRRDH